MDAHDTAARPLAQRRVVSRAERVRPVPGAPVGDLDLLTDPEAARRRGHPTPADAHRRAPPPDAIAQYVHPESPPVDENALVGEVETSQGGASHPADSAVGPHRKADLDPLDPRWVSMGDEQQIG